MNLQIIIIQQKKEVSRISKEVQNMMFSLLCLDNASSNGKTMP
jgi:hypothetical protein